MVAIDAVPIPDFIARAMPINLPTVAPAPAPTLPSATGPDARGGCRAIAAVCGRPDMRIAEPEVEQDRGWHDRDTRDGRLESLLRAPRATSPTRRGVESERAAAGEDDGIDALDGVDGIEQVRLASAGRAAAHVDGADRWRIGDDDRAPRRPFAQGVSDRRGFRGRRCSAAVRGLACVRDGNDRQNRRHREQPRTRGASIHQAAGVRGLRREKWNGRRMVHDHPPAAVVADEEIGRLRQRRVNLLSVGGGDALET